MKKIVCIDLDGVLNTYSGNYVENEIPPIRYGAHDFLQKLSEQYLIYIFTTRNIDLVDKWLTENNLKEYINKITNIKEPYASIFLDDRAINFNGNLDDAYNKIIAFKPYWK